MKECVISFDDSVSPTEIEQMFDIFKKFKGVVSVQWAHNPKVSVQTPNPQPSPQPQAPPQSTPRSSEAETILGDLDNIALKQAKEQSFASSRSQSLERAHETLDQERKSGDDKNMPSRYAISFALKWGISSGKVPPQSLEKLDPESIVKLAMGLLSDLPENEKRKLGKDLSGLGI